MKKFLFLLVVAAGAVFYYLNSGSDFKSFEADYKKACDANDYVLAHEMLTAMNGDLLKYQEDNKDAMEGALGNHSLVYRSDEEKVRLFDTYYNEYKEIERYVILHEATYILESQGLAGLPRISFLAKQYKADWLYDSLQDIALSLGNDEIINRLELMKKGASAVLEEEEELEDESEEKSFEEYEEEYEDKFEKALTNILK